MKKRLRIIDLRQTETAFNLAVEEYFFHRHPELVGPALCLLYVNQPSVVIGKSQNAFREVSWLKAAELEIPVQRRISGGGAVYHDLQNLNYSFIVPRREDLVLNYKAFLKAIREYLEKFGLESWIYNKSNLYIGEHKISGNAQALSKDLILHHGTLLYASNLAQLTELLHHSQPGLYSKAVLSEPAPVKNIAELIGPNAPSLEDFRSGLIEEFKQKGWPGADSSGEEAELRALSEAEEREITELLLPEFRSWEWNYARSAKFTISREWAAFSWDLALLKARIEEITFRAIAEDCTPPSLKADQAYKIADMLRGCELRIEDLRARLDSLESEQREAFIKAIFGPLAKK
ncbi:MAG: lipoate--protein ligase family protein [Eubacteriales bacterium]|nr:lipoate--protein ligase family protein [Eubacteriales bacterium]